MGGWDTEWEVRANRASFFCFVFFFYCSISSKYVIYYPLCCIKIISNVMLHILSKKFEKQKKINAVKPRKFKLF